MYWFDRTPLFAAWALPVERFSRKTTGGALIVGFVG
jgi:hypothetical protein